MTATLVESPISPDTQLVDFSEVERLFHEQVTPLRLHPGAALAVYANGQLMLDLATGWADAQRALPVDDKSLFPLFSGTKPLIAIALLQQIERGLIGLDEPVWRYWPEFACNGKADVTVRHVLTHRGGFPNTPLELPPSSWHDQEAVLQSIANMTPEHEPGTTSAYHFLTQHWVCAEIIRRIDGRDIDEYVRAEITDPLGMNETFLGLPVVQEHRLVKLHATDGTNQWGIDTLRSLHAFPIHRHVIAGASGVSSARDMARFYAMLAGGGALDGVRILTPETVEQMLTIQVDGDVDKTFDVPVRRGLGIEVGGLMEPKRHWPGATSTARTMWHGGFGTSVCWGDAGDGIAMAFMTNGVRADEAGAIARRDLSDAVRAAFQHS